MRRSTTLPLHHLKHVHLDQQVTHSVHPFGFAGPRSLTADMNQRVTVSQTGPTFMADIIHNKKHMQAKVIIVDHYNIKPFLFLSEFGDA